MTEPLLELDDLTIRYRGNPSVTAVSDASFDVERGEYFGLVGESGCGKSTIAKAIIGGLSRNGEVTSGQIRYKGEEIQHLSEKEFNQRIRMKEISWIPQNSMNSLDPIERIRDQAVEIGQVHTDRSRAELVDALKQMFETVGISPDRVSNYPHEFSGGMKQRAIIALALFLEPSIVIADEPTTGLDVIIQDQIFKYLDRIREDLAMSLILITHDISLAFESCEGMAVMHAGQVAETGPVTDLYHSPRHPYSILLQDSFPSLHDAKAKLAEIDGVPPQPQGEVDYCTFIDRCPWAEDYCRDGAPPLEPTTNGNPNHLIGCFRRDEIDALKDDEPAVNETLPTGHGTDDRTQH